MAMTPIDLTPVAITDIVFDSKTWYESQADTSTLTEGDLWEAFANKIAETIDGVYYDVASDGKWLIVFPWSTGEDADTMFAFRGENNANTALSSATVGGYRPYSVYKNTKVPIGNTTNLETYYKQGPSLGYLGIFNSIYYQSSYDGMRLRYFKYTDFYMISAVYGSNFTFDFSITPVMPICLFHKVYDVIDKKYKGCVYYINSYRDRLQVHIDDFSFNFSYVDDNFYGKWSNSIQTAKLLYAQQIIIGGRYYDESFCLTFPDYLTAMSCFNFSAVDVWNDDGEIVINSEKYVCMQYAMYNQRSYWYHGIVAYTGKA